MAITIFFLSNFTYLRGNFGITSKIVVMCDWMSRFQVLETTSCVKNRVRLRPIHQKWWNSFPDPAYTVALVHRVTLLNLTFYHFFRNEWVKKKTQLIIWYAWIYIQLIIESEDSVYWPDHNLASGRLVYCRSWKREQTHVINMYELLWAE